MATVSDLAKALNPAEPKPTVSANPFGQTSNTLPSNPGQQLTDSVNQDQQQFAANYDAQRSNLLNSIKSASIGGSVINDPLAPDTQAQQNNFNANQQAVDAITQTGIKATQDQATNLQNQWNAKLQQISNDFKTNEANAAQQGWNDQQVNSMLQQMPTGANMDNPGARAVAIAKQSLGVPYEWGGNSLTQGVDCSGLVQQVYGKLGIQLPRTSTEQAKSGKLVPNLQQALPGDLILEYSPYEQAGLQQYGHVGIYLGNGLVIEAPGTGKNVRIGPIVNMTRIVRPW